MEKGGTEVCESGTKTFHFLIFELCRLIERSELLGRRDELLPQDVLTVALELEVEDSSSGTVFKNAGVQATAKRKVANVSVQATAKRKVANVSVQATVEESVACGGKGEPSKKTESPVLFDPNLEILSLDLSKLLQDQVLPDVKLLGKERKISAHRAVLAARSEVFAAMFRHDTEESKTGVVDVTDLDSPVLDLFLRFVYTGKIQGLSEDLVPGVYAACDKYAVHSLKKACSDRMIAGLTECNCVSSLTVADAHSDAPFKDEVVSFICRREAIFQSEVWLSFQKNHKELAIEVYESYFQSKSRTSVDSALSFSSDGAENELAQPAKRRKFCR